jgi:hypothetical protein
MGKNFAIGNEIAGLNAVVGTSNTVAAVLSRGAIELTRQYIENDGKVTNWSGVALAMFGQPGKDVPTEWKTSVEYVNKNRRLLSAGLSVVEKFARDDDVEPLDWTNVAAAVISGEGGVGHFADKSSKIQWDVVAREALVAGGLSLVMDRKYKGDEGYEGDEALNFFGSQLGSIATGVLGELNTLDSYRSSLGQAAIDEVFNKNTSPYQRQQALSDLANSRYQSLQDKTQAIAKKQQSDVSSAKGGAKQSSAQMVGQQEGEASQTTPVTDNGVVQTYAATPYPSAEKWELLPAWGDSGLPYYSGDNLSKWLEGSNSEFTKADYLFGIASNLYDNPEDVVLQLNEAFYDSGPETYTNPVFEIAGFMDPNVDLSSMSISQQAAFMQDRFERASGHAYSAGQSYLGVEQTVLDLIVGLESSMSGRIGDQLLYNSEFSKLSQFDQVVVQTGAAFNQAIEGFQGLLSLGGAILNDTGGPNGLTNRAINAVGDGWEMADFIQQDQRLVDAVVRYGKQYIPSMPAAEQGGAAIGLAGTFGTGVALKGLQAIKASENLSGLFDKFSDAVSRAQMPIGLELQAGKLYGGFPYDAVKWKGFAQNKLTSGLTGDAASIISSSTKGQLRRQAALSRASIDDLGIVSKSYTNLPGSAKNFPGVRRLDDQFFVIDDQAAYIRQVEKLYADSGNTLNSVTRSRILEHVGDGTRQFPTQAGIPGLHAEIQSVNSVLNQVPAGFDLSRINVSTIKLAPGPGQGLPFPACSNCGGILSNTVNILTGVK